jgi:hypothetical protein
MLIAVADESHTEHKRLRIERCERDEQTAEPASYVCKLDWAVQVVWIVYSPIHFVG